jgi:hypothetical protein
MQGGTIQLYLPFEELDALNQVCKDRKCDQRVLLRTALSEYIRRNLPNSHSGSTENSTRSEQGNGSSETATTPSKNSGPQLEKPQNTPKSSISLFRSPVETPVMKKNGSDKRLGG